MNRRAYWFAVIFSVLMSFSYTLWCWHDLTTNGFDSHEMREQTKSDHASSIGYALAKIVFALGVLELIPGRQP